jgi:glycosyltransferase involved in cell wall biosynthesis
MIDFRLYESADDLLVHTNYEKVFFEKNGLANAISVVGNGIDGREDGNGERFRSRFNITGPMVLFIGRKEADKGYPIVVEAFKGLQKKIENAFLICIGPGQSTHENLKNIVELGYCEEALKQDALSACDLLCVPSEAESFGLVYMEAACYRKAILARRLPVLDELLGAEGAAILLGKPGAADNRVEISADNLAVEMERLLSNADERMRLGNSAFRVSRKFLWANIATRFERAYQTCCVSKERNDGNAIPPLKAL